MKRFLLAVTALTAVFGMAACTNPASSGSNSSAGSTSDTIPTYLSFELDTPSYPYNSTLSNAGTNGFFSVLYGDTQVTGATSGTSGTSDKDTTLKDPTVNTDSSQAKVGEKSVKISHVWRQAKYVGQVTNASGDKHDVLMSSLYLRVGSAGTDGDKASLLGNIPGTTAIAATSPYNGASNSVTTARVIDNHGLTEAYKVNLFVPAASTIDSFALVLYDVNQNPLQTHYQSIVKGQWNRLVFYVQGASTSTNKVTETRTSGAVSLAATVTAVTVNGVAGAAGTDYVGGSFDPSAVRFLGFRVFNTDGTGTVAADATTTQDVVYNLDDIGWAAQSPLAAVATADVADGTFDSAQTVTLSTTTPAGVIKYTTDGSDPSLASNTAVLTYSAPLSVSVTTTLKYYVTASGYDASPVSTSTYTIVTTAPTFTPSAGSYATSQTVVPSTTSTPAKIYYTYSTTGTEPDDPTTASTDFSVTPLPAFAPPATGSKTYIVKAIAVKTGIAASSVSKATFVLSAGSYTVTLDPNYSGGSASTLSVLAGGSIPANTSLTRTGYDFVGWYTDSALTTAYTMSSAVTSDFPLYAKWAYVIQDFEKIVGSTIGLGVINYNTAPAVVTPSAIAAVKADPNVAGANGLMVISGNGQSVPYFNVTLPALTGDATQYKALSFDVFAVDTDAQYKKAYVFTKASTFGSGAAWSSTLGSGNLIAMSSGYSAGTKGSWQTVTMDLTDASAATLVQGMAAGTAYIGLGLDVSAGAVYFISNVKITDNATTPTSTVIADWNTTTPSTLGSINWNATSLKVDMSGFKDITASPSGGKALLAVVKQYNNSFPAFTAALASGDSLGNYSTLKYSVLSLAGATAPASLYAVTNGGTVASPTSLGNTAGTTVGTGNLVAYNSSVTTTAKTWTTQSFNIAGVTALTSGGAAAGSALNIGLGLGANGPTIYLIDQVEVIK